MVQQCQKVWFHRAYGGGDDVFVHYSVIEGNGFRTLTEDQAVQFEVEQGPKGLHAIQVTAA